MPALSDPLARCAIDFLRVVFAGTYSVNRIFKFYCEMFRFVVFSMVSQCFSILLETLEHNSIVSYKVRNSRPKDFYETAFS